MGNFDRRLYFGGVNIAIQSTPKPEESLILSPKLLRLTANNSGTMGKITITCNDQWTVETSAAWITSDKMSGDGNSELNITAAVNTKADERTGTVTVTTQAGVSKSVSIVQDGAESTLTLNPVALHFGADGSDLPV